MVARVKTERVPSTVTVKGGLDVVIAGTVASGEFCYYWASCVFICLCPMSSISGSDPNHEVAQEHQRG